MIYKRSIMSIAMATIVLVSLCAVCATASVSAAQSSEASTSSANVQSPLAGAPAGIVGAPAVCPMRLPGYYDNYELELFVRGTDNTLWWKSLNETTNSWSAWKSLGGVLTSSPAAAGMWTNRIYVFVRGTNGALYSRDTSNGGVSWNGWASLGGQLFTGTGPAACYHVFPVGGGYLRDGVSIFVTGTNKALYQKDLNGSWTAWKSLGGVLTSSPAAAIADKDAQGLGIPHAYARGTDGALYDYGGSWSKIGGQILANTGPAAWTLGWSSQYGYSVDVFVTGTNNALYHKAYVPGPDPSKSWSAWESLGGQLTSSPAAAFLVSPSPATGYVFVRGSNGLIYQKEYSGGVWTGWYGPYQGPP